MSDTSGDGMPSLSRAEHSTLAKAKRVQFRGLDPADGNYYSATVRALGSNVAVNAAIVDGSGNQVTSFGGGTQYTEGDTDASITGTALMWEDSSDTLRAVSAAKPLPVDLQDATVAVTQSGTWDEVGINDSGNSITVDAPVGTPVFVRLSDGSSAIATLPVSLASVPSHAVTNAGTFVVQENGAALTALQLIDDPVATDDTTTHSTGTTKVMGIGAVADPTDAAVNANDIGMPAMNTSRFLKVILQANSGVDIGDTDVTSVVPGTGATNLGKAIDTATGSTDTGVLALATRDDDLGTLTPADNDNVQLRTDSEGALWATLKPQPTEGLSTMNATSSDGATALTNSAQVIKASAGTLYGYYIYNPNSSAQFVQFYNTAAASVTVGTTNPLFMLTIPATSAANLSLPVPIVFTNAGWSWAATSTAGGNGAPTTALDAVAWYK